MRLPRSVRRVTDPVLVGIRVPVISGVNRGRWWSIVSAGSGYASGRRQRGQLALLTSLLEPGDRFWDVGAHHGFVTLAAARRVGPAGRVDAFEPSRRNRAMLDRHLRWNRSRNVHVHPFALSDRSGETSFGGEGTSKTYALGCGSEMVAVRTASELVRTGICPAPTFVKLDVEGAEADAITGALDVLPSHARLLVAVHGPDADARCTALLDASGFSLVPSRALEACRRGTWRGDPDLYCMGPDALHVERDLALLRRVGF